MSIAEDFASLLAALRHYFLVVSSEAAAVPLLYLLLADSLPSSMLRPTASASVGYTVAVLHTVLAAVLQHRHRIDDAASCARADRRLRAAAVHKLQLLPHHHSSSWSNRRRSSPGEAAGVADAVEGVAAIAAAAAVDDAVALATGAFGWLLRRTIAVITIDASC